MRNMSLNIFQSQETTRNPRASVAHTGLAYLPAFKTHSKGGSNQPQPCDGQQIAKLHESLVTNDSAQITRLQLLYPRDQAAVLADPDTLKLPQSTEVG